MPMPPSTWMQSLALAFAASIADGGGDRRRDRQLALVRSRRPRRPRQLAATEICSERSSISAHMCLIAWKLPIGLPNCSRTFAYSVAVSSVQRARPAASAASTVAARSSTRCAETVDSVGRRSDRARRGPAAGRSRSPSAARRSRRRRSRRPAATRRPQAAAAPGRRRRRARTRPCPDTRPRVVASASARQRDARGALPGRQRLEQRRRRSPMTSVASAVVATGPGTSAAAASSTIAHRSSTLPPAPPCSSGSATPKIPSSASPCVGGRHASGLPCSTSRAAAIAPEPAAQLRTSSRAANCSSVMVPARHRSRLLPFGVRRPCFPLERVLIVPAFDRQVDRHYSRTRRCPGGAEVGNQRSACVSFSPRRAR